MAVAVAGLPTTDGWLMCTEEVAIKLVAAPWMPCPLPSRGISNIYKGTSWIFMTFKTNKGLHRHNSVFIDDNRKGKRYSLLETQTHVCWQNITLSGSIIKMNSSQSHGSTRPWSLPWRTWHEMTYGSQRECWETTDSKSSQRTLEAVPYLTDHVQGEGFRKTNEKCSFMWVAGVLSLGWNTSGAITPQPCSEG